MYNLFTKTDLSISISRKENDSIFIEISSDYNNSDRKSQLHSVNEERIAKSLESTWKSIKTTKKLLMSVGFFEIDWYDSCDSYDVPSFSIKKGLKKTRIEKHYSNSIPKDWGVDVYFRLKDTTTKTPILEVVKKVLSNHFSSTDEKTLTKMLKPFLQKKTSNVNWYYENN